MHLFESVSTYISPALLQKTPEPLEFYRFLVVEHRRKPPRGGAPAALTAHVPRLSLRESSGSVLPGLEFAKNRETVAI